MMDEKLIQHVNACEGILLASSRIAEIVALGSKAYEESWLNQSAIERQLLIVSEAARKLSDQEKAKYKHIFWRKIYSTGNVIRHEYGAIEQDIIWDTAENKIPELLQTIKIMLTESLTMRNLVTLESQIAAVGKEVGVSDWILIDQAMIDRFADVTQDHQFIHIDPVRAASEGPFGTTIAHGFLTVSLLSQFSYQVVPGIIGMASALNYGFDKLRFMSPVKSGKRIRARFTLADLKMRGEKHVQRTMNVTVEIEGEEKPALIAEWVGIVVLS